MLTIITTSRRQGQFREKLSGGSPSAKLRADGQKSHIRPSSRGELAFMPCGYQITKPTGSRNTVNVAVVQ